MDRTDNETELSTDEDLLTADGEGAEPTSDDADAAASDGTASDFASEKASDEGGADLEGDATPKAADPYTPSYVFLIVVTLVNLVADLWSKGWAKGTFENIRPGGEHKKVVIEGVMNFIFAKNRGGAWGLLQNETEALRRPFFLIVSVAAIVFIVSLYRKVQRGQTALKWGLPLVLGGALGNLVDRIRYGYVVDFIDIYTDATEGSFWVDTLGWSTGPHHWPTFNVADISICVGVAFMAIDMFTSREPSKETDEAQATSPEPQDRSEEVKDEAHVDDEAPVADAR